MATYFRTKVVKNLGVTPTQVVQIAETSKATAIGMSLTNLTESIVSVSVLLTDGSSTQGYFLKDVEIPPQTSLRAINGGEKLIIAAGNELTAYANVQNAVDIILSYVEII
ncbi:hypothetical protein EB118_00055 [bacterium]|nr:hypothetical protein [bacterium]